MHQGMTFANLANTSDTDSCLTVEKLRAAYALVKDLPPAPAFDLWPHDLPSNEMYELQGRVVDSLGYNTKNRRQLVVPRIRLDYVAYELKRHGADVRVQPQTRKEPECDTTSESAPPSASPST